MQTQGERARESTTSGLPSLSRVHAYLSSRPAEFLRLPSRDEEGAERNNEANRNGSTVGISNAVDEIRSVLSILRSATEEEADEEELYHQMLSNSQPQRDDESSAAYVFRDCRGNALALATFLAGNRAPESTMEHPFAENRRTFTKHISVRLQQLFQQNFDNTTTSTTTSNIHNLRWGGHMILHANHSTGGEREAAAVESVEEADVSVPPSASSSSPSTCRGVIIKSWSSWKAARYFHRHVERLYRLCTFFGLPTCVQPLCAELCVVSGFPVSIIEIPQGPIRMAVGEMLATTANHITGRNSQPTTTTTTTSISFFVDEVRQLFEGMRGKRSAGCRLTAADYELWMNTSASQVTVVPSVAGCLDCYSVQPGGADEDDLSLSLLQSVWSPSCILPPVGFPNVKLKPLVGVPPLPSLSSSWLIVSQKLFHNSIRSVVAAFADLSERQESLLRVAPWFVRDVFHSRGLRLLCLRLVRRLLISELQSRGCRFVAFVHKLTTEATSRAMKRLCLSALRNRRTADIDMDPEPLLKDATRHDAVVPMLLNKLISRFLTKPSFITETLWPKIVAMFPSFGGELEMNPHRYSVLGGTTGGGGALLQSSSSVTANNYHRGAASIMLLFGSGGFTSPSGTFGTFGRQVGSMPSSVANSDLVPPQLHSASSPPPPPPPPVSASVVEDPSEFDFAKVSLPDVLSYLSSALGVAFSSSTKQFHSSLHAVIVVPILNSPTACALPLGFSYPMHRDLDPVVVSMETESAAMQQLLAAESCECIAACPTSMLLLRNAWRMGCSQTRSELQRVTSFDVLTHDSSMPHHLQEGKPARLAVGFLRRGLLAESSAATVMLVEDSLKRLSPRVALRYPSTDLPDPQPSMSLRDWVSDGPVFMSVFQEVLWSHSAERGSSSVALATQFRDHDTTSNLCLCDVLALWLLRTLPFSRVVHTGVSSPPLISPASIGASRWSSACLPPLTLERALSGPSSIATHSHVSREIMQPTPCLWALSTDQCLSSIDHLLAGMESIVSSSSYGVSIETLHMSLSVMLDAVLFTMDTLSLLQQPAATVEKKREEEPVFSAPLSGASTRLVRLLCILGGGLRVAIRRSSVSTFEGRSLHCFGRLVQPWLNEKDMTVASASMPPDGDSPSLPQPFPAVLFLSCLWLLGPLTGSGFSLKISSEIAAAWLNVIEDDPETFIEDPNRSICDFESQILHNEDWLRSIHAACMSYLNVARDVKGDDQSIVVHATTTSSTNGRTLPRKVSNTKKMNSNRRSQEDECNERRAAAHDAHVRAICSFLLKRMEKSETAAELLSDVEVVTYPLHRADRERRQVPADVMMTLVGSPSAVSVDPTSVQRERETMSPQRHRPSGGDSNVTILRRVPSVFSVGGDAEVSSPEKASPQISSSPQQVLMVHTNEEARRRLEQSVQKRRMSVGLAFANLDGSPEKRAPILPPAEPGTQTAMSASKPTGPSNIITNGNNTASSAVNRAAALRQQKTRDIIQRTAVATSSQDAESLAVEKRRAEEELRKKEREDAKIARFLKQQQQRKKPQHVSSLDVGRCLSSMEPGSSTECPAVDTAGGVRAASTDMLLSSQRASPGGHSSNISPLQRVREEARVMLQALNVDGKDAPIGSRAIVVPEALAENRSVRASRKTVSLVPLV